MNNFDFDLLGRLIVILVLTSISCGISYGIFLIVERIINRILKYMQFKNQEPEKKEPDDVFFFGPVSDWKEWGKK